MATLLGIIIDFSLDHSSLYKDTRLIDLVKKDVIQFIRKIDSDNECYFYNESNFEIHFNDRGAQVAQIANYDPVYIDIEKAIKQTLFILENQDDSFDKKILYLTNRLNNNNIKRIYRIEQFISSHNFFTELHFCLIENQELIENYNNIISYNGKEISDFAKEFYV